MTAERLPGKRPAFEPGGGLLDPAAGPPSMPRPTATVAGAGLVLLRVAAGVVWLVSAVTLWLFGDDPPDLSLDGIPMTADVRILGIGLLVAFVGGFLLMETVLAVAVLRGRNGPRVALLVLSTLSVAATFAGWWEDGQQVTIQTTLVTLSLDILILLALSSRASAAWARRPRVRRRQRSRPDTGASPTA